MKLTNYIYDTETVCPECGARMETVRFYSGRKIDTQVNKEESVITGRKTTTVVTSYTDVKPELLHFCTACRKKDRDKIAEQSALPPEKVKKFRRMDAVKYSFTLLLSLIIPITLGILFRISYKANTVGQSIDTLSSYLLIFTVIAVLIGIRFFINSLIKLTELKNETYVYFAEEWSPERTVVAYKNSCREDKAIRYFTEKEYGELHIRR